MDRADRFAAIPVFQILRQERFDRVGIELLQNPKYDAAQKALRYTLSRGINRRDPAEMDRAFRIIFNHFEFGMIHADAVAAKLRLSENDELLAGRYHFLDVVQIEPATNQRLAQGVCVGFL